MRTNFSWNQLAIIILLITSAFIAYDMIKISSLRQSVEFDKSILGNVKYGLFSVYEWKYKITTILFKKIDEFELNSTNKGAIQKKIEEMMITVIDEGEKIVTDRMTSGNVIDYLKGLINYLAIDFDDLRDRAPEFTSTLMDKLGDQETLTDLKGFLKLRLSDYLDQTIGKDQNTVVTDILNKYGYKKSQISEAFLKLESDVMALERKLWNESYILIALALSIFLFIYIESFPSKLTYIFGILTSLVLLLCGILTPMIDLDARINSISFILMNEEINFSEQILFYQSKSILDVFWILAQSDQFQNIAISILVLTFSVIFPVFKLYNSYLYLSDPKSIDNRLVYFFVFRSGKWSMADVIVVAIFMSYIGFNGIINSQLTKLTDVSEHISVVTSNNTQLQAGFLVFTAFSLMSIFLSGMIARFHTKHLGDK